MRLTHHLALGLYYGQETWPAVYKILTKGDWKLRNLLLVWVI